MKYANVKFECPDPCNGQIHVVGAVVYPSFVVLVGRCSRCNADTSLNVMDLLEKMFDVAEEKEPS